MAHKGGVLGIPAEDRHALCVVFAAGQPLDDVVHIFVFWGKDRRLSPQEIGQKKTAAVVFGSGFVTLVSATTIEAVMRTQGRNSSGKRARSP